jgi:hypothetical protein
VDVYGEKRSALKSAESISGFGWVFISLSWHGILFDDKKPY